ncbi:MAG: citrate lyase acyl carrier protein [Synergistales bacterium]
MVKLVVRMAQAGTLESADCLVTVVPAEEFGLDYRGGNRKLFGERTRKLVLETLDRHGFSGVQVTIRDQGALELVIRARLETALKRATAEA